MPTSRPSEPAAKVLLVEGKDDKHVVRHIQNRLGLNIAFSVLKKGGDDSLRKSIPIEMKASGRQCLGILVDADTSVEDKWRSVSGALSKSGLHTPVPHALDPLGTVIAGQPRVGVWIMPDNQNAGQLEDFIAEMIPAGDPVWPLAQQYINGIPADARKFRDRKILKAQLHAWLAAREEPRPMGSAIRTGELQVNAPLCQTFANWLVRLFQ